MSIDLYEPHVSTDVTFSNRKDEHWYTPITDFIFGPPRITSVLPQTLQPTLNKALGFGYQWHSVRRHGRRKRTARNAFPGLRKWRVNRIPGSASRTARYRRKGRSRGLLSF